MKRRRTHSWFCLSLYFKYALSYYAHTQLLAGRLKPYFLMRFNRKKSVPKMILDLNEMETKPERIKSSYETQSSLTQNCFTFEASSFFFHQLCSKVTRTAFLIYCRLILQQLLSRVVHNGVIFFMKSQLNSDKVENILKCSMDSIPSPSTSVKIKSMGRTNCLRCKGKTLLGIVNKLLKTKNLLTSPSNVLPYYLK